MHASGLITNHRLSKKGALQDYNAPFIHGAFLAQVVNADNRSHDPPISLGRTALLVPYHTEIRHYRCAMLVACSVRLV